MERSAPKEKRKDLITAAAAVVMAPFIVAPVVTAIVMMTRGAVMIVRAIVVPVGVMAVAMLGAFAMVIMTILIVAIAGLRGWRERGERKDSGEGDGERFGVHGEVVQ